MLEDVSKRLWEPSAPLDLLCESFLDLRSLGVLLTFFAMTNPGVSSLGLSQQKSNLESNDGPDKLLAFVSLLLFCWYLIAIACHSEHEEKKPPPASL